jgi:ParB-like chromosome segregation protein Spo0J
LEVAIKSPLRNWRDVLPIHPAADLFPLVSESELKELAEDIRKNGLQTQIVLWSERNDSPRYLLDGRNRLDALALLGWLLPTSRKAGDPFKISPDSGIGLGGFPRISRLQVITKHCSGDPYAVALALNVHRRHLTADQKRELIEKLLKAKPEASNRTIAKQTKVDHKTVGKTRAELEGRGEIPHVEKRTDTKGRKQPSAKPKSAKKTRDEVLADQDMRDLIETAKATRRSIQFSTECGTPLHSFDSATGKRIISKEEKEFHEKRKAREAKIQTDWLADHPGRTVEDFEIAGTYSDTPEGEAAYCEWMRKRGYLERDALDTQSGPMPADPSPQDLAVKRFLFAADSVIETAQDAREFLAKVRLSEESTAKIGETVDRVIAAWQSIKDRKAEYTDGNVSSQARATAAIGAKAAA